jgi:hypothetical protein
MVIEKMETPEEFLAPLVGKIAFSLKQSHGSFFFIEFGDPRLKIREPIEPRPEASEASKISMRRRRVHVIGTWSFFVKACNWTLTNEQRSVGRADAPADMEDVFRGVEGQYLVSARVVEETKALTLDFDLGGCLRLWPRSDQGLDFDPGDDQWRLHFSDGTSVGYTNDGSIASEPQKD